MRTFDHGLALLTDHIHVNEHGAPIIASLIGEVLEDTRPVHGRTAR